MDGHDIEIPGAAPAAEPGVDAEVKDNGGATLRVTSQTLPNNTKDVLISVSAPAGAKRSPADICAVVDISGSMQVEATIQNADGGREAHGLSILDVVKHAVKTVLNTLDDGDRFSLVTYSNVATVVFPLQAMTAENKQRAVTLLDNIEADGQTNLWDGLHTGLEELRQGFDPARIATSCVLILTDGQPNVEPPRGHIPMLRLYKDEHPNLNCTICTFGFGYNLDSKLLSELAHEGHGMYTFIPDSGFVGTAFVNVTGNVLSTVSSDLTLKLEPLNHTEITEVSGTVQSQKTSWGVSAFVGSFQYDQSKDVVVRVTTPPGLAPDTPYIRATIKYTDPLTGQPVEVSVEGTSEDPEPVQLQRHRIDFGDYITRAMTLRGKGQVKPSQDAVVQLSQLLHESNLAAHPHIVALLADVDGQVTEALSRDDWYKRWGRHYLPSLLRAHSLQQCNNFKDPGVQVYGGALFKQLRDRADRLFMQMPPPQPKIQHHYQHHVPHHRGRGGVVKSKAASSRSASAAAMTPASAPVGRSFDMSLFNNAAAGCFAGDCVVQLENGSYCRVDQLKKGDRICGSLNQDKPVASTVLCVVKTSFAHQKVRLVQFPASGLRITAWHPIRLDGVWHFPCQLVGAMDGVRYGEVADQAVYNLVLEEGHVAVINGVEVVTLAHHMEGPVVGHAYYGTDRVLEDLRGMDGFEAGLVQLGEEDHVRDPETGLVCSVRVQ